MELSAEQLQEITSQVIAGLGKSDALGKAVADGVRRIVPGVVESGTKQVAETVASLQAELKKLQEGGTAKPTDKGKGGSGETPEELLAAQGQIEELRKRLDESDQRVKDADARAVETRIRSGFLSLASEIGMRGVDFVYSRYRDKLVEGEDGALVIEVPREAGGHTYTDKVPIQDWLTKEFLASDEGKPFIPARAAGGSGGGAGAEGFRAGGGKPTKEQLVDAALGGALGAS